MNKDVIYIEPEDDITDIIAKIEKAKAKIVALVPPKKAGVFRSLVNIKLIAKAGAAAEKSVVLVTVDPSIVKLAAATKLPVAKNLQTAPVIPEENAGEVEEAHMIESVGEEAEEIDEDSDNESDEGGDAGKKSHEGNASKKSSKKQEETEVEDENFDSEEDEEEEKEKPAKKKKTHGGPLGWVREHKKLSAAGGVCFAAIIGFLIWAFGFAPAADITVAIRTDAKNFSEGITFVSALTDENAKEGKFYLEQKKIEKETEVKFDATGQKNNGEKATGEVVALYYFPIAGNGGSIAINAGSTFTTNGLSYTSDKDAVISWDGDLGSIKDDCENWGKSTLKEWGCQVSTTIAVTAVKGGASYNIGATSSGWSTTANVIVRSDKAMSGGTDEVITVVQQSDVEAAKASIKAANEDEAKEELYKTIDEDEYYIIDTSFNVATESATATPGVDEEVKEGTQPVLKAKTVSSVYVINKNKLKEFIAEKADLEDGQKVYEVKSLYIENFVENEGAGSAKLKGQYYIGPKITETEVVEKVMGKGLGDAQREIRDLYGVSDVRIDTSYPWVMAIPADSNKVSVKFEIKDQNGNEIKASESENGEATEAEEGEEN